MYKFFFTLFLPESDVYDIERIVGGVVVTYLYGVQKARSC